MIAGSDLVLGWRTALMQCHFFYVRKFYVLCKRYGCGLLEVKMMTHREQASCYEVVYVWGARFAFRFGGSNFESWVVF